jgi:outer membrane receptor for ferrienterochelin and colicin
LSFNAEYMYERFKRDNDFTFGVKKVTTHRVPLGINFFHPSGLSASLKATYFNQDGDFGEGYGGGTFVSGDDEFWVVDAAVRYRLPKRYGFITVGVTNLFDKTFKYFDTDFANPMIQPDRTVFARITLALP